ncbi:MAG TPA: DUF58 domain-containing protein [Acidimicrobiia bacterium]|jgi:uncharacterized protein (DUF58 family)
MRRRVELTRRGGTVLGAALGLLVAGRLLGSLELTMLGITALALLGFSVLWVARRREQLGVVRTVRPVRVQAGSEARVDLEITNHGERPNAQVAVTDSFDAGRRVARFLVPSLQRGQQARAAYRVPTAARGRFTIGPLALGLTDPFGLAHHGWNEGRVDEIIVTPRIHDLRPPFGAPGRRRSVSPFRVAFHAPAPDGEDFLTLRDYEPGDDLRRIHWRSTARTGELFVRQDETRWEPHVSVLLDTRATAHRGTSFEAAVEAVASVAVRLARSGERFEVITTAGRELGATRRERRLAVEGLIMDELAEVAVSDERGFSAVGPRLRPERRRGLLVAVVGDLDTDARAALAAMATASSPVILVVTGSDVPRSMGGAITVVDGREHELVRSWDTSVLERSRPRRGAGRARLPGRTPP